MSVPAWLSALPWVVWGIGMPLLLVAPLFNKYFPNLAGPPVGPPFSHKGDSATPFQTAKSVCLSTFPLFFFTAGLVGVLADAPFAAEPRLELYVKAVILPLGCVMIPFHIVIIFRRGTGHLVANLPVILFCTAGQLLFMATNATWAYYALACARAGGSLEPHAPTVRAVVWLVVGGMLSSVVTWAVRAAVLLWSALNVLRVAPTKSVVKLCEELYFGVPGSTEDEEAKPMIALF